MKNIFVVAATVTLLAMTGSCRKEEVLIKPSVDPVTPPDPIAEVTGFYLLNEGNMGSNKASLDYYNALDGNYTRNIYAAANPDVPMELGDVGNDLKIYRDRLWAVINCSNKVEVMDAATARRVGQIDIPNCRFITFDGDYAYVTSYAGPVEINPDYSQRGFVAKIDVSTLEIVDRVDVGFQPDQAAVAYGRLYVANSGGYMVPNYEKTLSVIDLASFKVVDTIEIAINLQYVIADRHGRLWVTSRGDYYGEAAGIYCYDIPAGKIIHHIKRSGASLWLDDDLLYFVSSGFSYETMENTTGYGIIDVMTGELLTESFITDATRLRKPYSVAVNPVTKEIYVTDARNHVNPGDLYCFSREGKLKWKVRTGDIPSRFAFTTR